MSVQVYLRIKQKRFLHSNITILLDVLVDIHMKETDEITDENLSTETK
jgi:hypothetical protein